MASEVLRVERRGPAALLTIDRPHAGNSISAEVTAALDAALTSLEGERDLVAIVICGAGDKFFSAGANIRMLQTSDPYFKYFFCMCANIFNFNNLGNITFLINDECKSFCSAVIT